MAKNADVLKKKHTEFALAALMEIPSQYKATLELGLLGRRRMDCPGRIPLPPPVHDDVSSFGRNCLRSTISHDHNQTCPVCLSNPRNMAFGCGHQTCCDCGQDMQICPICRNSIKTRIKLY